MPSWGNKNIDSKTEWIKRADFDGVASGLGVVDSRYHLGDDKTFSFGYDVDFQLGYSASTSSLVFTVGDNAYNHSFNTKGVIIPQPHAVAPDEVIGGLATIHSSDGTGATWYQLHQSKGVDSWEKFINTNDVINSSGYAANNDDTYAVPSVKAVKDAISSAGVSNSLVDCPDTNITSPADGSLLLYDTATSKWLDNVMSGDGTLSDTGALTIASDSITYDKMQDTTGSDIVLGRSSAGGGTVEEIVCTSVGRSILAAATLQSFDWYRYGGWNITRNWKDANNADGDWYLMADNEQNNTAVQTAEWDPDTSTYDLQTDELARSYAIMFPKAGKIESIYFTACSTIAIADFKYVIVKWNADVSATLGDANNNISGTEVLKDGLTSMDAQKYYSLNSAGLNISFNAGDALTIAVRTTNSTVKPNMNFSISVNGSYT